MLTLPAKRARKSGGFTLVELVIVLVILSIAIMIGLPSFQEWVKNAQIRTAAESIKNGLQVARMEAIKSNTPVLFSLVGNGSWQVDDVRTNETLQESTEKFNQVTITSTPAGSSQFAFNGLGRQWTTAIGSKEPPAIPLQSVNVSFPTAPNTRPFTVTVTVSGSIRLCNPSVTASGDPRKC